MNLHYETWGHGPPLAVLHGLFGSLDNWHSVSRDLAGQFEVLAIDQRNHGRSPHSPKMSYPLLAQDLREFLEQRGLGRVSVLGHSMGGKTAMEFALRWPVCLDKLIVVEMAPRAYPALHDPMLEALLALDLAACPGRQQMEAALEPAIPSKTTRRFLLKNVERDPGSGVFRWRMNLQGISENYPRLCEPLAPGRSCARPALFLRGGESDYLRPEDFEGIRSLFPNARFRALAGAGHWVHADAPEEFLRIVREFLEEDA